MPLGTGSVIDAYRFRPLSVSIYYTYGTAVKESRPPVFHCQGARRMVSLISKVRQVKGMERIREAVRMRALGSMGCLVLILLAAEILPAQSPDAALADAAMRGDRVGVQGLLARGADVNARQADGIMRVTGGLRLTGTDSVVPMDAVR